MSVPPEIDDDTRGNRSYTRIVGQYVLLAVGIIVILAGLIGVTCGDKGP